MSELTVYATRAVYFMKTRCVSAVPCVHRSYTPGEQSTLLDHVVHAYSASCVQHMQKKVLQPVIFPNGNALLAQTFLWNIDVPQQCTVYLECTLSYKSDA